MPQAVTRALVQCRIFLLCLGLKRVRVLLFGLLLAGWLSCLELGVAGAWAEDGPPSRGVGVALLEVEPSNLNSHHCSLLVEFENRLGEEILAFAVEVILFGHDGKQTTAKALETFDLRPGVHRQVTFGVRVAGTGSRKIRCQVSRMEIVPRTCLGRSGDLFTACQNGLFESKRSTRPVHFQRDASAVPLPDSSLIPARGHRARESETIDLAELGVFLSSITAEVAEQFGVSEGSEGLLVLANHRGTSDKQTCVSRGDIIRELDQTEIFTVDDAAQVVRQAREKGQKSVLVFAETGFDSRFCVMLLD